MTGPALSETTHVTVRPDCCRSPYAAKIMKKNVLITGGAGFIGSHVVRRFVKKYSDYQIINLDKLTYAGNLENLRDIDQKPNYTFIKADICDFNTVLEIFKKYH